MLLQQLSIKVELNKETEKSFECELGKQYSIATTGVANDSVKPEKLFFISPTKDYIVSILFTQEIWSSWGA